MQEILDLIILVGRGGYTREVDALAVERAESRWQEIADLQGMYAVRVATSLQCAIAAGQPDLHSLLR